jgi:hypothetical protein
MSEKKPLTKGIKEKLMELQIEAKNTRKNTARNILVIVVLVGIFLAVGYYYPQLSALFTIGLLVAIFGGVYIVFLGIPTLYQPLEPEQRAFKKIAKAVEVLGTSDKPLAYEEAYNNVNDACKILNEVKLSKGIGWYKEVNRTFEHLLKILQTTVLPAIKDNLMKEKHLAEIALAIVSMNQRKVREVNKKLVLNYEKAEPEPSKVETFLTAIRQSTIGKVLGSLMLGYGLVLVVCFLYALGTGQDFMTFLKDRPDIVILGGLIASGITFWKTK